MNKISVLKLKYGDKTYYVILVNTKIKYFWQNKCLVILFYSSFLDSLGEAAKTVLAWVLLRNESYREYKENCTNFKTKMIIGDKKLGFLDTA